MSETDYAWAAGVLEGDGSAYIIRNHIPSEKHVRKRPKPAIRVVNYDLDILKGLKEIFGGTVSRHHKKETYKTGPKRNADCYAWYISYRKAEFAAKAMLPYVKGYKRDRLLEIIDYYAHEERRYHVGPYETGLPRPE